MTLLIFDCDGVLVDSEILHSEIESQIGREMLGIERDALEHNRLFSGLGLKKVFETWATEAKVSVPPDIYKIVEQRKSEAFTARLKAIPFIKEALSQVQDLPRCVASGTPLPTLEAALRTTHLLDCFAPNLFSSMRVARGKPAPDLFLLAAREMGIDPKDCLVIEDSTHGVNAALAAKMRVIGFTGGSHCASDHAEKLRGANRIVRDMRELWPAVNELIAEASHT